MSFIISHTANHVNRIANHPSVRPHIDVRGTEGMELDFTEAFSNGVFAIVTPDLDGAALLIPDSDNGLEAHTMALPEARQGKMAQACLEASDFLLTDQYERIYGYTPIENTHAQMFNEKIGFSRVKELEHDFGGGPEHVYLYEKRKCQQQQ